MTKREGSGHIGGGIIRGPDTRQGKIALVTQLPEIKDGYVKIPTGPAGGPNSGIKWPAIIPGPSPKQTSRVEDRSFLKSLSPERSLSPLAGMISRIPGGR